MVTTAPLRAGRGVIDITPGVGTHLAVIRRTAAEGSGLDRGEARG